jgi:hypothetical protein
MRDFTAAPDIFTFQECDGHCICGANGNFSENTGKCVSVSGKGIASALNTIGPYTLNKYTFKRNQGRVIGWRDEKFSQIGEQMNWGANEGGTGENFAQCSGVEVGDQITVALKDIMAATPKQVVVSTGHWFVSRDCACAQVRQLETSWKTATKLKNSSNVTAGNYADIHILTGDHNAEPGTKLPTAYRNGGSCDGQGLGGDTHNDVADNTFTFCQGGGGVSTPATCTNKQKVDYIYAKNYNGSGITQTASADTSADYVSDHRAVRGTFTY